MVPVDEAARRRAAGGSGRLGELSGWRAAVTDAEMARVVVAGPEVPAQLARRAGAVGAEVAQVESGFGDGALSVPEVAAAVDMGRGIAAAAARDGVGLLAGVAPRAEARALA